MKGNFISFIVLFAALQLQAAGIIPASISLHQDSVKTTINGNRSVTTFFVNVSESGNYRLSFWLMGVKHADNTYSSYDLRIDNDNVSDQVTTDRGDWHTYSPNTSSSVYLTQGSHSISLEGTLEDIPNAEKITCQRGLIYPYHFISSDESIYHGLKIHSPVETVMSYALDTLSTRYRKIECFPNEGDSISPPFYYTAELNKNVFYTFRRLEYYIQGQTINFQTDVLNGVQHVLNIFSKDCPADYSWSTASTGEHASLSVTIPHAGFYYVMVRTDDNDSWGTCNLTINNDRIFENIPVCCSKTEIALPPSWGNTYSCFAKSKNGDPVIMLMDNGSVVNYNDNYPYDASLSDYDWGKNARIDGELSSGQWIFVTTRSLARDLKFDIYTGCEKMVTFANSNLYNAFPNLKVDDSLRSSAETYNREYNCISWAVGEWLVGYWLGGYASVTTSEIKYKDVIDSIFSAYGYGQVESATSADIDLWGKEDASTGQMKCTHASIKSKSHLYAAGYDWESKIGADVRMFHPRYALNDGTYGNIFAHYASPYYNSYFHPGDTTYLPPIFMNFTLNQNEYNKIENGISLTKGSQQSLFADLYEECQRNGAIKVSISIDTYEEVYPYSKLLSLCKENPELCYLLYQKICKREILAIKLLKDMIVDNDKQLVKDVAEQIEKTRLSLANPKQKIWCPLQAEAMLWVKTLLTLKRDVKSIAQMTGKSLSLSNDAIINADVNGRALTIRFDLPTDANVSVLVGNLDGSIIKNIINQRRMTAGSQQASMILPRPGIYTIGVVINGSTYKKKINVK